MMGLKVLVHNKKKIGAPLPSEKGTGNHKTQKSKERMTSN